MTRETRSLLDALGIEMPALVSLVGGGGKTTLMFALAAEAAVGGHRVITTTTTRILRPGPTESPCLILEADEQLLAAALLDGLRAHRHVTAARALQPDGKLLGLMPETVDRLVGLRLADLIVNEADGAARLPIKAPGPCEPVMPSCTRVVVAVVGMDALGATLDPRHAFRPELISRLTGLAPGDVITMEAIARLATSNEGMLQYSPPGAEIVPFLNKADLVDRRSVIDLAAAILRKGHPRVHRVAWGALRASGPYRVVGIGLTGGAG